MQSPYKVTITIQKGERKLGQAGGLPHMCCDKTGTINDACVLGLETGTNG